MRRESRPLSCGCSSYYRLFRDCGAAKIAYGEAAVATPAAETETHKNALLTFKAELAKRQPKMGSQLGLMALDGKVELFS